MTHFATLESAQGRYQIRVDDQVIADTTRGVWMKEQSRRGTHEPVLYIPLPDLDMSLICSSSHKTVCPIKGSAHYYSIQIGEKTIKNAIWFYPEPATSLAGIRAHVAFYTDKVTIEQLA